MKKTVGLILILLLPLFVFPQKLARKTPVKVLSEKEQKLQAQKIQAIGMIEKTAEEAVFWEDRKTAIEALAEAADLLWNTNPAQSARWLNKAWKLVDEISAAPKNENLREFFTRSDKSDLYTLILSVALKHDAALAEQFLKQLAAKDSGEKDKGAFDDKTARSEQLLRLAQQSIETDPNLAYNLAERSLADGISYSLQNVLTELRKKDVNLANRLFDAALSRFTNSVPDTSEAQVLVGYLFKPGFTMAKNTGGQTILVVNPAQQNLPAVAQSEPVRARNFLNAVFQAFFSRPLAVDTSENKKRAEDIMLLGNRVASFYDRFAAELAQPMRVFLVQLQAGLYPDRQNQNSADADQTNDLPKNATKEEIYEAMIAGLEERADKETDPIAKKIAYIKAAVATRSEDHKRGRRIAEKIEDENLREDVVSFLLYRAALYFVGKKEIETAEELAPQIKETLRRSVVKIAIAQALLGPNPERKTALPELEKQRAFALLNDVWREMAKEDSSRNTVKILLGTAAVSSAFDKTQSINLFEEAIQKINRLDKFNLKDVSAPKLDIDVFSTSGATVETPRVGFGFRTAVESLIETDFEQISSIVERLGTKEIRGIGRLEVAKTFFQKNKNLLKS